MTMSTSSSEHRSVHRQTRKGLSVSCICRASMNKHTRNMKDGEYCEPMNWLDGLEWKDVYNNPTNHYAPFTDKDRIL